MPMQEQRLTGVKKRQQIESANHTMFIWVAIASVAVSVCIVASQFFLEKLFYNQRVIDAKTKAADTLTDNIENAKRLKQEVDSLVGSQDLAAVKTNPSDPNTKSVLDALPSREDPTGLATSLQQTILSQSSVVIESITVPGDTSVATDIVGPREQRFSVTVTGSYDKIKAMMLDLERTIRPIKITTLNLNGTDASMRVTLEAVTYYQPAVKTNLKEQVIQ